MNSPNIPKEPELVSEERLEQIVTTAVGKRASARPAAMRAFRAVARDAARAALEELAFFIIEVDRSACRDTRGVRCPWWDEHAQGAPGCSYLSCGFKDGAVLVREKKRTTIIGGEK